MHILFNKGSRVNKLGIIGTANLNAKDKNLTEIIKKCVYAQDNFMLRQMPEKETEEKVH